MAILRGRAAICDTHIRFCLQFVDLLHCDSSRCVFAVRLGIIKEMQPLYVATFSEKPQVLDGHPFVVEAGVSLGGSEVSGACKRYGLHGEVSSQAWRTRSTKTEEVFVIVFLFAGITTTSLARRSAEERPSSH